MIHENGQVIAVDNEAVWVACGSRSGCARCDAGQGCGGALMSRLLGDRQLRVRATCKESAHIGDHVTLALDEAVLLRCAVLAYLLPLTGLLGGALAGQFVAGESGALIGSLAGLSVAWSGARWLARLHTARLTPAARLL